MYKHIKLFSIVLIFVVFVNALSSCGLLDDSVSFEGFSKLTTTTTTDKSSQTSNEGGDTSPGEDFGSLIPIQSTTTTTTTTTKPTTTTTTQKNDASDPDPVPNTPPVYVDPSWQILSLYDGYYKIKLANGFAPAPQYGEGMYMYENNVSLSISTMDSLTLSLINLSYESYFEFLLSVNISAFGLENVPDIKEHDGNIFFDFECVLAGEDVYILTTYNVDSNGMMYITVFQCTSADETRWKTEFFQYMKTIEVK